MKNIKHLLFLSILCSLVLFTNCGEDSDDTNVQNGTLFERLIDKVYQRKFTTKSEDGQTYDAYTFKKMFPSAISWKQIYSNYSFADEIYGGCYQHSDGGGRSTYVLLDDEIDKIVLKSIYTVVTSTGTINTETYITITLKNNLLVIESQNSNGNVRTEEYTESSQEELESFINASKCGNCNEPIDLDNDGITDCVDSCQNTPSGAQVDELGCEIIAIYLDDNGITLKANEISSTGEFKFNGEMYLIVETVEEIFSSSYDLSKIVTSRITDMSNLFIEKNNIVGDISNWDVSNVTTMRAMFGLSNYNPDLSAWDVSKVEDMQQMFDSNESFNQDISNWDVGNLTRANYMFYKAYEFNQDLRNWDVSNVTICQGFSASTTAWTEPKPNFTNCTE